MPSVNKTLGARFKIEGEAEYKRVIQDLNAGSRTLSAEMKLLQTQYKGNTESVEFLASKSELLGRMLDQQKEKTAAVRTMVEAAAKAQTAAQQAVAEATGKSEEEQRKAIDALEAANRKYQEFKTQLYNAETAEVNLQHEIEDTTKALNGQDQAMSGLGDTVSNLAGRLGIQLPQGATKALNGMGALSSGTVVAMSAAVAGVAALIKTVKQLQETTIEAAARADDIMSRAASMAISAQQYQALQYASPFVDVDVDTLAASLSKLTKAMGDAKAGSDSAKEAFANLGVEYTNLDGSLRNSYDVWLDVMDALSRMGNETERDAAAMSLLGKSAQDFAPIYREGTAALKEYTEAAAENYVMSDKQLEALGRVDDAVHHLNLTEEANKNMIASQWAPTAEKAITSIDKLFAAAGKTLADSGLIRGFGELVEQGTALLDPITSLLEAMDGAPGRIRPVYEILHGIAGTLAWIADAGEAAVGFFTLRPSLVGKAMGYGAASGNYSHLQQWNGTADVWEARRSGYQGNGGETPTGLGYDAATGRYYDTATGNYVFPGSNAGGSANWRGGLTWVGESGPELVSLPAGSQILNTQDSQSLGGDTYIFDITVDDLEDLQALISWAKSAKTTARMR